MGDPQNTHIMIRVTPEFAQQIRDAADREERTVSALVRLAVRRYLEAKS